MTAPWWDGRLCAIDCETTGVNPEEDRIVQVAVWLIGGGIVRDGFTTLVDPGVPIAAGATEVHGITNERATADGIPIVDVAPGVASAVLSAINAGYPLVAFNARFDLTLIDRECRRHGCEVPPWERAHVVDPLVIDKHIHRYRKGSRKLAAICETYGATLNEAHAAEDDAIAAARAAWVLGAKGEIVRRVRNADEGREKARLVREWERVRYSLPALHTAQIGWAREQASSLREYFEKKGQHEDAVSVSEHWPIIPAEVTA